MIPPKRVLVGVDFSECSRTALAFAARLTLQVGGDLDVLHVQEPMLTAAARTARVNLTAESAEELQRVIQFTPPAAEARPETFVICGTPGTVLCDIAAREQADLLVVGAHGMTGAARWLFGANTERALRHARMSVLVVPSGWRPPSPETNDLTGLGPVIVAADFTEPALLAVRAAARLARLLTTSLTVLHVVPELRVPDRWMVYANDAVTEAARRASLDLNALLSPVKDAANVKTPTLFFVGENDVRVPLSQSIEMYRALRSHGVPTHLYVAPREGHQWQELRHQIFKANTELAWFARYALGGASYVPEQAPAGTTR